MRAGLSWGTIRGKLDSLLLPTIAGRSPLSWLPMISTPLLGLSSGNMRADGWWSKRLPNRCNSFILTNLHHLSWLKSILILPFPCWLTIFTALWQATCQDSNTVPYLQFIEILSKMEQRWQSMTIILRWHLRRKLICLYCLKYPGWGRKPIFLSWARIFLLLPTPVRKCKNTWFILMKIRTCGFPAYGSSLPLTPISNIDRYQGYKI